MNTAPILQGTLIINAFLHSAQTDDTYKHLVESAKRHNIDLDLRTNADYFTVIDSNSVEPIPDKSDFILFWNKDTTLGDALEDKGFRLYNPSSGIRICDNKSLTVKALAGKIRMPKTYKVPMTFDGIGYNDSTFIDFISDSLGYPFVIKECWGSYGGQVYLANNKQDAIDIFSKVDGTECIACEYISSSFGRDLRAYVVGDRVVAAMERSNPNDFRANITNGGMSKPYKITKSQKEMAIKATKLLGLDFAGVDLMFLDNDEPILCEVNSNAQFLGLYQATGIDITDAIFEHIITTARS